MQTMKCPCCGVGNLGYLSTKGFIICPHCGFRLYTVPDLKASVSPRPEAAYRSPFLTVILLGLLSLVVCGILITAHRLSRDFEFLKREESQKAAALEEEFRDKLETQRAMLEREVKTIDLAELHAKAAERYQSEFEGRLSYDKRFALSKREKAQLRMQALASDSTRSFHDTLRAVAREASPQGSEISVEESSRGIALGIDFDMSSMTSGEEGTRTKHDNIESLRKEVVSLISRVTNDVFIFCKDLELASIHVGCRHHVQTTYPDGSTRTENTLLYKVRIDKKGIPRLSNNPFLDTYSTTEYLEVEADNFGEIEIVRTII